MARKGSVSKAGRPSAYSTSARKPSASQKSPASPRVGRITRQHGGPKIGRGKK